MTKKSFLSLLGISALTLIYFLFFTVAMVDPKCGGCEVAVYMRPYEALIKGRKILKPSFRYTLPPSVAPVATLNPAFHPSSSPVAFQPYTAQFTIVTHGTKRVFTDPKYHNQSKNVFLTSNNPSTLHVEKENITWSDFFATLPFSVTKDCLITGTKQTFCNSESQILTFSINGQVDPNALDRVIKPNDEFLLTVSDNKENS